MPDPAGYFNRRESDVDLIDAEAGGIAVTVTRVWPAGRVPAAAAVATWRLRMPHDRRLNLRRWGAGTLDPGGNILIFQATRRDALARIVVNGSHY